MKHPTRAVSYERHSVSPAGERRPPNSAFCANNNKRAAREQQRRTDWAEMTPLRLFLLLNLAVLLLLPLNGFSQNSATDTPSDDEASAPAGEEQTIEEPPSSLADRTLAQDILTASFRDLIAWNASLDLSTRGGRRELENRLFDHYGVDRPADEAPAGGSEIIIEAAKSSRYFTIESPEEEYLVLRGGVVVQMRETDGDVRHRIEADQVVYNQARNTLSAMGDITYTVEREETTEVFTGESLQFRLDSWDGIFLEGETKTSPSEGEAAEEEFAVRGTRLSRSPQEIIVVEEGSITSSVAEPPNYSIDATKIWVLAPGEWGIQNAVLKVGRVPVFYFPFFFLPGDKLFFHPAVGYEPRRGTYIQTTTYLLGAPERTEEALSLLQMAENNDEALREIQGLFLVLPENPTPPENPNWYLKIMADIYTNLGGYVGVETDLPGAVSLDTLSGRAGVGVSRTLFSQGGGYTPYYVAEDGTAMSNWESGWLLGTELPFRYEAEVEASKSLPNLNLSLSLLLLSDPEFRRDFGNRKEQFDWSVILSGLDELESEEQSRIDTLTWRFNSSLSPPVPSLSPWVTSFSVERLNASLQWRSREWPFDQLPLPLQQNSYTSSGEAAFFYPSELTAPDLALRLQGELFAFPEGTRRGPTDEPDEDGEEPNVLRPPWDVPEQEEEETTPIAEEEDRQEEGRLPPAFGNQSGITPVTPFLFRLRYQIAPSLTIDNVTASDDWQTPPEIDGELGYSSLRHQSNYQLSHDGYFYDKLVTFNGSLLFALNYQDLLEGEGVTEAERQSLLEQSYRGRSRRLTQTQSIAYAPLRRVERLQESRLRYDLSTLLYERTFLEVDPEDEPVYEEQTIEFTDEFFTTHRTSAELRLAALQATQSLTLGAALPPRDGRYDAAATAETGPLTSRATTAYVEDEELGWRFEPLQTDQTLTIIADDLSLGQRFTVDLEEERLDRSISSIDAWFATASYEARRSAVYEFDPGGTGWTTTGEERFQPYTFTLGVDATWEPAPLWKRRIQPEATVDASYQANLVRFTESAFRLSYGLNFSIYRFLDLQFEAVTVNDFTYQYVPSLASRADRQQRSIVRDLGDSLALFDTDRREETFFKLESIRLSAVHDLQDWELTLRYEGEPTLESGSGTPQYRWESVFSIFLRWRPISEIQSTITYDDGDLDFEN